MACKHKPCGGETEPCGCAPTGTVEEGDAMTHFFWQGDLVNVSKVLCECLDVVLGADSDDQSQTSEQPWVAGKGVID